MPPGAAQSESPATSTAWSPQDLRADPHQDQAKARKVRDMFSAIAHRYDLNNRLHSFGRDQAWRRAAVRMASVRATEDVLDVACGTGDLTRAFADSGARSVTGLDFTPKMLEIARTKRLCAKRASTPIINYIEGDAQQLPFEPNSFDIVSIAFGIRNVTDPGAALLEFRRVLRPNGRLIILEFAQPRSTLIATVNNFYTHHIMPRTATLLSGDRTRAYFYLPRSIDTFLSPQAMTSALQTAGFSRITSRALTFGVCVCYRAEVVQ